MLVEVSAFGPSVVGAVVVGADAVRLLCLEFLDKPLRDHLNALPPATRQNQQPQPAHILQVELKANPIIQRAACPTAHPDGVEIGLPDDLIVVVTVILLSINPGQRVAQLPRILVRIGPDLARLISREVAVGIIEAGGLRDHVAPGCLSILACQFPVPDAELLCV